ncbi:MAG TPA: dienelactone hydrolase family protein [Burkholderiaceae bacterium]|nr:dienelactone hydrolase family protein [Burkholderiaceae bacterium]
MKEPSRIEAVTIGPQRLPGELVVPRDAAGLVVFAHGSGSSRLSPRNVFVAAELQARGLGTLLFDLLTESEAEDRANVFDIGLLGARVSAALDWIDERADLARLRVGLFGASTGAAAALVAAAGRERRIAAVVSRGGRPDLAGRHLARVKAATLLIVGGDDRVVLQLNRDAFAELRCEKRLEVVGGATHLFEEEGALERVATLAADWFVRHLASAFEGRPRSGRS